MKRKLLCLLLTALAVLCTAVWALAEEAPVLNIAEETATVAKGKSITLTLETGNLTPEGKKPKIVWETGDKTVAAVANGKVTGKGPGTVTITASVTLEDGTVLSDTCQVTVTVATQRVSISTRNKTKLATGFTLDLEYSVQPADATDPSVLWTSSDESIAAVDGEGRVTGVAPGTVTVTGTPADGGAKAASVQLQIVPALAGDVYCGIKVVNGGYAEELTYISESAFFSNNNYYAELIFPDTEENRTAWKTVEAGFSLDGKSIGKDKVTPDGYRNTAGISCNVSKYLAKLEPGAHELEVSACGAVYTWPFEIVADEDLTEDTSGFRWRAAVVAVDQEGNEEIILDNPAILSLEEIRTRSLLDPSRSYRLVLRAVNTNTTRFTDVRSVSVTRRTDSGEQILLEGQDLGWKTEGEVLERTLAQFDRGALTGEPAISKNGLYELLVGCNYDRSTVTLALDDDGVETAVAVGYTLDLEKGTGEWKSSDPEIAAVDENGVVTGVVPGIVKVFSGTASVRVKVVPAVTSEWSLSMTGPDMSGSDYVAGAFPEGTYTIWLHTEDTEENRAIGAVTARVKLDGQPVGKKKVICYTGSGSMIATKFRLDSSVFADLQAGTHVIEADVCGRAFTCELNVHSAEEYASDTDKLEFRVRVQSFADMGEGGVPEDGISLSALNSAGTEDGFWVYLSITALSSVRPGAITVSFRGQELLQDEIGIMNEGEEIGLGLQNWSGGSGYGFDFRTLKPGDYTLDVTVGDTAVSVAFTVTE